ncbi:MAG TPA: MobA/MobL family protein, partial [Erysipelothrix sp.]
ALELSGSKERIDHRSYEAQNLDLEATIHEGPKVTQLRRKGIETEISQHNDQVKLNNEKQMLSSPEDMQQMLDRANDFASSRLNEWKARKEQERQEQLKVQRQEQARIEAANKQKEESHSVY